MPSAKNLYIVRCLVDFMWFDNHDGNHNVHNKFVMKSLNGEKTIDSHLSTKVLLFKSLIKNFLDQPILVSSFSLLFFVSRCDSFE